MLDPQADCFRPPSIPTEVCCLHCGREYNSYLIEWRVEVRDNGEKIGFWCCPTEKCGGRGFGFDILPLDPEWEDPDGRDMGWYFDDEDDELDDEDEYDDEAMFDANDEAPSYDDYPIHEVDAADESLFEFEETGPIVHLHPIVHPVDLIFLPPWARADGPPAVIDLSRRDADPTNSPFIYEQINEDDIPF